jgi:predicted transcriptional regulator
MDVLEAGTSQLIVTHPDELVCEETSKMLRHDDIGRLLVVDHADHGRALGYLSRSGVMAARPRGFNDETFA